MAISFGCWTAQETLANCRCSLCLVPIPGVFKEVIPPELIDSITVQSTNVEKRGDVDILVVCLAEVGDGLTDSLVCKHKLRVGADRDQVPRDTLCGFIVKF